MKLKKFCILSQSGSFSAQKAAELQYGASMMTTPLKTLGYRPVSADDKTAPREWPMTSTSLV